LLKPQSDTCEVFFFLILLPGETLNMKRISIKHNIQKFWDLFFYLLNFTLNFFLAKKGGLVSLRKHDTFQIFFFHSVRDRYR
jgi:hypothetical protein